MPPPSPSPASAPVRRWPGRFLRAAVALLVAASLALTAAQQAGTIGPWWLELSRYLPFPVLLAPPVLAFGVSLALGWRWLLASGAAIAGVAVFGMGLAWGRPDADPGATPLRFMTYNIKAYRAAERPGGYEALAREVARWHPDVLVVQDRQGDRRLPAIEARLWPDGRLFGFAHVERADEYVVASRWPLRGCVIENFDPARARSVALRCKVDVDGRTLEVVTVHFDSPREGLNATRHEGLEGADDWARNHVDRLWQSRLLAARLRDLPRPMVVAGDLNAPESSRVVRTLLDLGLRDAWSSAMRGYGYSYGQQLRVGFSFLRIDHVLVSPRIGVARVAVGDGEASQHRPVIADLLLPWPSGAPGPRR